MKTIKAKDFMTKYVFTVSPDTTVQQLVRLFVAHPVSAIPVVGDDNELLGIVSEGDLLYKKVTPKIPAHVDVLGGSVYYCGFGRYEQSFRKLLATTAGEIMTKDVRCVHTGNGNGKHHYPHGGSALEIRAGGRESEAQCDRGGSATAGSPGGHHHSPRHPGRHRCGPLGRRNA